jgi:hypothetical protein
MSSQSNPGEKVGSVSGDSELTKAFAHQPDLRLRVVREAVYAPPVVSHLVSLVRDDLQRLPTYSL